MGPRIEILREKKLIGKRKTMSFSYDSTQQLWREFMRERGAITNGINPDLISLEIFPEKFFFAFDPTIEFEKWAAVEVSDLNSIPEGMESLVVPGGPYAVFIHKGPANEGQKTYNYIFTEWVPGSEYTIDSRPHFAVMGEKYKHNGQDSEEEIWIPIKPKSQLV